MSFVEPQPFRLIKNLNRGREVLAVMLNYGFGDILERLGLMKYIKLGQRYLLNKKQEEFAELTTARRIRLALQELGPTFVKFGQVLSTRPDLIPLELIEELSLLQESVPPFPTADVLQLIEKEFRKPVAEVFPHFEEQPLAAGSLGQVHRATDDQGRALAVKIRRPHVVQDVERDISLMLEIAQLLEKHLPESRIFDPVGLVNHFTRTIRREMSFRREARTMQEFARRFEDDPRLYVPFVDQDRSTDAILTMGFVEGFKVDDYASFSEHQIDRRMVALTGAKIFLKQAFEFGIFHGDPHPGNIRIRPDGTLVLLDYGMIGFVEEEIREQLVDLLLSISRHNVDQAVETVLKLGHPSQPVERPLLQADVRDFIDAHYGVDLGKLDVGQVFNDFIGILSNHGLRCPGDLMMLIRAMVTLEGVGRKLDAQFNLAEVLSPAIEKLVKQRYDPKRIAERTLTDVKQLLKAAHDLPLHLGRTLQKASQDDLKVQLEHRGLDKLISEFDRSSNRIVVGLVVSSLVVATALVIRVTSSEAVWFAAPLFLASGLLGLWLVWGILRSGRL